MARNRRTKRGAGQRIIANMGLLWKQEKVRWKKRGHENKELAGERANEKTAGKVDFWRQTGIYALYNTDYHLIYMGQAGFGDKSCIGSRLKHHLRDGLSGRWDMFSWFGLRKVTNRNKLGNKPQRKTDNLSAIGNVLEAILIEVAEPPMNGQGGRFGRKVERYLQMDESIDENAEAHQEILDEISKLSKKRRRSTRETN